ncbi:MAG: TonB-dependent receptor [Bacteroidales bacterium]|nr:TonB-dependent receptor [Bacteroidales bacterium]
MRPSKLYSLFLVLTLLLSFSQVFAQGEIAISGKVTDASTGSPLPGATITENGTNNGTVTDMDGNYTIIVTGQGAVLTAAFIGFQSLQQTINNKKVINFNLEPDLVELEEIAVVGYGVQKRSNITGSISSIETENIENKSQVRLDQALQGLSSGVFVSQNGGAPGAAPTVHIRGVGSIGNTEPLWVIDGVPMSPGNHFDINDVQSIEILKDASASAIYGVKAAHGVILINTKRGKEGLDISFKSSIGKRIPIKLPELLGSEDFVKYKRESRLAAGQNPEPAWDEWEHDTDWIDAYYDGSGILQTYDFSISNGAENFNYYFSLGYDDETGILIDNTYNRYSARLNSDVRLTGWMKIGESLLLSAVRENPIDNFNENYSGAIPYRSIPIMPIYDEDNPFGGWGRAPAYFQGPNPVASQYQQHENRKYNRVDGNLFAEITPFEGMLIKATVGYNYSAFLGEKFNEAFNYGAFANTINSLTLSSADDVTILGNAFATYNRQFNMHNIKVMAGYEWTRFETMHFNVTGTDFPVEVARSMNLATGTFNITDRNNLYEARTLSYFGRFNYNYREKYLFEASIRRDASAPKFGPENIWGVFPSFSAGWFVSKENFFENVPHINTLKLRLSSGKLGSDRIGDYIYLKAYTSQFTSYAFDEAGQNKVNGFFIARFPNEEVKWEEVYMHNVGLNMTAFSNKLSFSIDAYIKDTQDMLYPTPIPPSVGIAVHNFSPVNPSVNIGTMRNMGLDIEMGYRWVFGDYSLNINGNTSFMKNEMQNLNQGAITGGNGGGQIGGMTRTEAGMPMSYFYGYVVQQMLNTPEDIFAINSWAADGTYQEGGTGPGDLMYKDISGPDGVPDGQITAEHDRVFIGNPWPKMIYGLNVSISKGKIFDINLQLQGVQGVDVFNAEKAYTRNFFGDNNTTALIYEAWTEDNHTKHPRNIASDPNGNFSKSSTYFVEDGSYLKLRNIQVGFNLPARLLNELGVSRLRLFINANNLLTITGYSGTDPEVAGSNTSRGVDYGLYPQVRTVTGGVELNF